MSDQPLAGVTVLDLSRVAAGPFATMMMADMGAAIIKIERPGTGDEVRALGRPLPGGDPTKSDYYVGLNRSKRSVAVDLSQQRGAELVRRLAAAADVVVENFRPGVAQRLGLGFDALQEVSPGLVYTSITGFGPSGPWSNRPANDIMMQSISGLMGVTGEAGGAPVRIGTSLSDYATGLFALAATLAALYARERFPEGQHVEVPMLNASLALLPNLVPSAMAGVRPRRMGRGHPQIMGYASFQCADGGYVTVGAFSETFWRRLCRVLGHIEWLTDPRFATNTSRLNHRDLIDPVLTAEFLTRTRAEWVDVLEAADVPCAPVLELDEALRSDQALHNRVSVTVKDGAYSYDVVNTPFRCGEWDDAAPRPAEDLGASTRAVLSDVLGMPPSEVDAVVRDGIAG